MDANPERWLAGRSAYICVNPGIRAHLQLIAEILEHFQLNHVLDPTIDAPEVLIGKLTEFINPIREFFASASQSQIEHRFARRFGEGGVLEYQYALVDLLSRSQPDFGSAAYKDYKANKENERVDQAARDVEDIQNAVSQICFEILKQVHGTKELPSGEKAYWDVGIESAEIKQKAYQKQQAAPIDKRAPREAYVDFIDYMRIFRQTNNWSHFEKIMNIPLPGEKGKKYYLDWMERINELRRVTAHKSPFRQFKDDDFDLIIYLKNELFKNAEANGFDL